MKKKIIIITLVLLFVTVIYAADVKWSAMAENTTVADNDVMMLIDTGSAASQKITVLNLFDTINSFGELNTIVVGRTLVNEEDAVTWDALGTFNLGLTIQTTDPFRFGANRIDNGADLLDGEMIGADTIDDDSIDWADCTFADFDFESTWKMWYSDAAGDVQEITLTADRTFLESNGVAAAPVFRALEDNDVPDTITIDLSTLASTVTMADDDVANDNQEIVFTTTPVGAAAMETDTDFHYNPFTGTVTATQFAGGGGSLTAIDAATGDSATAFFDAGTIEHEWGGLQADVSAWTGLFGITGADTTVEVDTSAEMATAITDETGSGKLTFATAPVFVTSIQLTGANADPAAAAGTIVYDNTIGVMAGGGLRWYDNDSVRLIVDLETDPSNDDYVVAYDAGADGFYMLDSSGFGATAWDDIGDPDLAATIDFVTYTQTIDIGVTDDGGPKSGLILDVTGLGAGVTDVIALEITTATDDDNDYVPIAIYDDSGVANDLLFSINYQGQATFKDGGYIVQPTDQEIWIGDNSDYFNFNFAGTDCDIVWSDGALNLRSSENGVDAIVEIEGKDAGEKGILRVLSDGDDKHIELHHDDTDGHIITNTGDIHIEPAGGDIVVGGIIADTDDMEFECDSDSNGANRFEFKDGDSTDVVWIDEAGLISVTDGYDGIGAIDLDYGSADITDHTFLSDGTGTGEFVLKAGAIDGTEILDDTITEVDLNITNAGAGLDNYLLSYNHAATNFTWVAAGAGDMLRATYDAGLSGGVDQITTVDSTYASDYVLLTGTAVGTGAPKTDAALTYDATSGTLAATQFTGGGGNLTGVDAATGDSATAFFDAGTIEHEYGGLQANLAAYTGLIGITGADTTVEVDTLAELLTAMGDVTAFITDDDMPAASADPDIDAAGEIGRDTDGGDETGDSSLRGYDGANQFLYCKEIKHLSLSIVSPDEINVWTGRVNPSQPIWFNTTGMTFTITEVYAISDTDNYDFTLFESASATDMSDDNDVSIIAIECDANGTECFTDTEAAIGHAVEKDHAIIFEDTLGSAEAVCITISGWFDADVD